MARCWTLRLVGAMASVAGAWLLGGCGTASPAGKDATALFNGRDLAGWTPLTKGYYDLPGAVRARGGRIELAKGNAMTGLRWAGVFPKDNYEVSLEAMRTDGRDFFCGVTFPVSGSHASLIVGGWGGQVVGISNVDEEPASENETTEIVQFQSNRWYPIRLRVFDERLTVWIGGTKTIDLATTGRRFAVWPQMEDARPFGFSTWFTGSALRKITLRRLTPPKRIE